MQRNNETHRKRNQNETINWSQNKITKKKFISQSCSELKTTNSSHFDRFDVLTMTAKVKLSALAKVFIPKTLHFIVTIVVVPILCWSDILWTDNYDFVIFIVVRIKCLSLLFNNEPRGGLDDFFSTIESSKLQKWFHFKYP